MVSNAEQLRAYQAALLKVQGFSSSEELQNSRSASNTARKYDAALSNAIAGKEASESIVIYYDEVIMTNKATGESYLLYDDRKYYTEKLEGLLMGCYTFVTMDKKVQKEYYDFENLRKTLELLDGCY